MLRIWAINKYCHSGGHIAPVTRTDNVNMPDSPLLLIGNNLGNKRAKSIWPGWSILILILLRIGNFDPVIHNINLQKIINKIVSNLLLSLQRPRMVFKSSPSRPHLQKRGLFSCPRISRPSNSLN